MTPKEIALDFSEKFQKNYPNQPLWKLTLELEAEIQKLCDSIQPQAGCDKYKYAKVNKGIENN